jgi:hypothetical protein
MGGVQTISCDVAGQPGGAPNSRAKNATVDIPAQAIDSAQRIVQNITDATTGTENGWPHLFPDIFSPNLFRLIKHDNPFMF